MELKLGDIQCNPFTFHLRFSNISLFYVTERGKEEPLFKTKTLATVISPGALLHRHLVCRTLRITNPVLTLVRYPDGAFDFSRFFAPSTGGIETKGFNLPRLPFLFSLNNITVNDGSATFDDRLLGTKHKAEKIALSLPTLGNFSSGIKTSVTPSFSAMVNGSPIQLTGEAALPGATGTGQTRLSFDLHDLDLSLYFNYLPLSLPIQMTKGIANGQLQISFFSKNTTAQHLAVLFQLNTKDVVLSTKNHSFTMAIPAAQLDGDFQPLTGNLHLQNVLFHEPEVQLQTSFSEQTLDALLPGGTPPSSGSDTRRSIPHFSVDLFVMDDGVLHIAQDTGRREKLKTYRSLQLSIKDYSNQPEAPGGSAKARCSFKLSGEQLSPPASFSWAGTLDDRGAARGILQLNRFPASLLGRIFSGEKKTAMNGTADMTGKLAVYRRPGTKQPFSYAISEGKVNVAHIRLSESGHEWLHAGKLTLGPLDSEGNNLDIGNIVVQDATLTLRQNRFPHLLLAFLKKKSPYRLHGLDFSGTVVLRPAAKNSSPLILNDCSMQANQLETSSTVKDNFGLEAKIDSSGDLKTKGTVALNPLHADLTVQFSKMPSNELLPWYSDSSFLTGGRAELSGQGQLSFPKATFKGDITADNASFVDEESKSQLTWKESDLKGLVFTPRPFFLGITAVTINHPVLTYSRNNDKINLFAQAASFLQDLLPKHQNKKRNEKPASPDLQIATIGFNDATVIYNDLRLDPPWQQQISSVSGTIQNLSSPADSGPAHYTLNGTIAGSPLVIKGSISPFAQALSADSSLSVSGIPVAIFKDQLTPLVSIDTTKGTFDLNLNETVQNGQLSGSAHYLFHGLAAASPVADTALPLALLADSDDVISATVPLTNQQTKADSPLFLDTIGYFKRLVVKSLVAPLLLASSNFRQLAFDEAPDFKAGENVLTQKGKAKLTLYRDLLTAHPRLSLEISGEANTNSDKTALQEQLQKAEDQRVEIENKNRLREWNALQTKNQPPAQHKTNQKTDQKSIVEQNIPAAQLNKYAPLFPKQITVKDQDLEHLALQRTETAYDFFTKQLGVAPDRIIKKEDVTPESADLTDRLRITLHALTSLAQRPKTTTKAPGQ